MTPSEITLRVICCPCCSGTNLQRSHVYSIRPEGETNFNLDAEYYREIWQCGTCLHYISSHEMDLSSLYNTDYVDSTYGGLSGIQKSYQRIMALDPARSDNVGRVDRVISFAEKHFPSRDRLRVLDIGAGIGVFLGKLKQKVDWECVAIEPDHRFAEHISATLGIEAVADDYLSVDWDRKFDLIALNKVLEHVEDPQHMLQCCVRDLAPGGLLYIELPDGEAAAEDRIGFLREEFFIEHHHVFSMASMELLTQKAGLRSLELQRIQEPSTKYTLISFLTKFT